MPIRSTPVTHNCSETLTGNSSGSGRLVGKDVLWTFRPVLAEQAKAAQARRAG
jgi:hypothetical protein